METTAPNTSSRILADVEMTGALKFNGGLVFEGIFTKGQIEGDLLIVGAGAQVQANIVVSNLTLLGRIDGEVTVRERCQLRQGSELHGNLKTARLAMEEGATFTGGVQIAAQPDAGAGTPKF
ncbi:MAG: polymer-forming cytoskeletal protein [Verrucomicrobia bacterium]|nr:polymer-forming cytoskeletal protein [Verrucomicrobiota bacterium]MBV9659493.1 polymer-forming cytoskeletal protein [Verrucomicrobiota bacterium]